MISEQELEALSFPGAPKIVSAALPGPSMPRTIARKGSAAPARWLLWMATLITGIMF